MITVSIHRDDDPPCLYVAIDGNPLRVFGYDPADTGSRLMAGARAVAFMDGVRAGLQHVPLVITTDKTEVN